MTTTPAIRTTGLSKRFGKHDALQSVDLLVPDGAVYVLVGANGAGKSTTFKILLNLETPTGGDARVFGYDTRADGPAVRALIGYVPEQQESPYPWMTCGRLLQHVAAYYSSWDSTYADHLVKSFDVRKDRRTGTLSKGELRRLQLVMAMAHRPKILLLDEPTEGLDPVARRSLLTLLSEHLSDSLTTVVISTHHVHEVDTLADHIGALNAGKLVVQMSRDDLDRKLRRYQLEIPDNWKAPTGLNATPLRKSTHGNDAQWTIIGDEREITARLIHTGARVRETQSLSFDDAALALLSAETR